MRFLHYLTLPFLWQGFETALIIAFFAFFFGAILGIFIALARLSSKRAVAWIPVPFVFVFRGTPLLLQLIFWFDVLPTLGVRLSATNTAIFAMALAESVFLGEIFKGGIAAVRKPQREAAAALGMSAVTTFTRIILPQALRAVVPAVGNEAITTLKNTSLASVISVDELTLRSQQLVGANFQFVPVFLASTVMYLMGTSVLSILQRSGERWADYERKGARIGHGRGAGWGVRQRLNHHRSQDSKTSVSSGTIPASPTIISVDSMEQMGQLTGHLLEAEHAGVQGGYIEITGVAKKFNARPVLHDVNLRVEQGEVVVILGPSGSGKSTLLRLINHLEKVDGGEILVGGELIGYRRSGTALTEVRRLSRARGEAKIGFVAQSYNLFEHMTVLENLLIAPVRVQGRERGEVQREALQLLEWAGLAQHAYHYPHQLSGGQQQRVAIIRAIVCRPNLMLLDEPTSALDPELVGDVLRLIRSLAGAGMTMVVVTHEVSFARDCADRVVFMDGGVVVEEGLPDAIFESASNERTRRFLQQIAQ